MLIGKQWFPLTGRNEVNGFRSASQALARVICQTHELVEAGWTNSTGAADKFGSRGVKPVKIPEDYSRLRTRVVILIENLSLVLSSMNNLGRYTIVNHF